MHKEFYAEYYDIEDKHWWFVGRRQVLLAILDRYLKPGKPRRILDVGCGTGTMLGYLSRYGHAQGIDADEEAVRFCMERGVSNVQQVTASILPSSTWSPCRTCSSTSMTMQAPCANCTGCCAPRECSW